MHLCANTRAQRLALTPQSRIPQQNGEPGETAADREIVRTEVLLMLVADQADTMKTNMGALALELLTTLSEEDRQSQSKALVGLRVGAFCLLRELGRGGMGTV